MLSELDRQGEYEDLRHRLRGRRAYANITLQAITLRFYQRPPIGAIDPLTDFQGHRIASYPLTWRWTKLGDVSNIIAPISVVFNLFPAFIRRKPSTCTRVSRLLYRESQAN